MKKFIREPFFQFLLIGAGLFLLFYLVNDDVDRGEILIDDAVIEELSIKWESKRDLKPTKKELKGLVYEYLEQEVLYREALVMNLDHNDEIIKRRLARKMEFLSDELADVIEPSEEILIAYFEEHKSKYVKSSVYSFQQVYFNPERADAESDAIAALNSADPTTLGDALSVPSQLVEVDSDAIRKEFGMRFVLAVDSLTVNEWAGPIRSGYGLHIVYISAKTASGYFSYEEVKAKVKTDFNFESGTAFQHELVKTLLKKYKLEIDLSNTTLAEELNEMY